MTVTPPRRIAPKIWTNPAAALDYEIAQEKASTLGRLGRALEAALAALQTFDAELTEPTLERGKERRTLVAQAGQALWHFVVQREALGLRDQRQVMRDYRVPGDVQNRMGMLPAKAR
ncbi:MAG: hypothetical protein QOF14_5555 [Hyphomicrobiales bacterium]|jgi:hypothetical protein|nr:hypothetical protein [Hyphomicrobiales bacterium]